MKYLISFGDEKYYKSLKILEKTSLENGADQFIAYNFDDLKKTDFYENNIHILTQKKGCGYWLWKPYIILEALKKLNDDDFLMYTDAAVEIVRDLSPLFELCKKKQKIMLFSGHPCANEKYVKDDAFCLMGCGEEKYKKGKHLTATFLVMQKNDFNIRFLEEWLAFCEDERILTDIPSENQESPCFIRHCHDQAILSVLAIKHDLEIFRDPSQYGNSLINTWYYNLWGKNLLRQLYKNSPYKQLLIHYRRDWILVSQRMRDYVGVDVKPVNYFLKYPIKLLTMFIPFAKVRRKLRTYYK